MGDFFPGAEENLERKKRDKREIGHFFDRRKILNAIKNSGGIQRVIYERLGVSRGTLEIWLKKVPELVELIDHEREGTLDKAEENIKNKIEEGDIETSKWFLARKGRVRGYDGDGGGTAIQINIGKEFDGV